MDGGWRIGIVALGALAAMALLGASRADVLADWRTANREPVGIAPDPARTPEAVAQIYAARTVGWRGLFGVHTWIATKRAGAAAFTIHEVVGWRVRNGGDAVVTSHRPPDGRWFGAEPEILADHRGPGVEAMIDRIEAAVAAYPHRGAYTVWPGPNSNTFVAHVARAVPGLRVDLPPTAIGKDYLNGEWAGPAPSGTGGQVSLKGLFGVTAALDEGLEVNLLGLTFGLDLARPALKLPMVGRLGLRDGREPRLHP